MPEENKANTNTKIALITGGSRGLGRNTALSLARKGVDVVITYHSNQAEADNTVAAIKKLGRNAAAMQLDTGAIKTFPDFASRLKAVLKDNWKTAQFDYLVNNAGIGISKPFADTTEADFDLMMNINLKGVYFLTQTLLPQIADGGRIVNLSSGLARFSFPGYSAYGATKGAIEVLTHFLAKELGPRRIAVNTVAPGAIETDFGGGYIRDNAEINQQVANLTALGRVGVPDDIGPMIAALLSEDNRWINGQRIEVSGGIFV